MNEQQLCDAIRKNLTEEEMKAVLENAGFAVHEEGQELVEALCEAVQQGDVAESVVEG